MKKTFTRYPLVLLFCACALSLRAQMLPQTHIVEAYNCSCGEEGKRVRSIQLGVRLDRTHRFYTALSTLVGCSSVILNVDGVRYPVRITMANARDNVATLEPVDMASNISDLEKKLKKPPGYLMMTPTVEASTKLYMVVLQGAAMEKQVRTLQSTPLVPRNRDGSMRYEFTMQHDAGTDMVVDGLMGAPVWIASGKDYLAGIVTGHRQVKGGYEVTLTGVLNVLDKSRNQLYHAYLEEFREELELDCGPKQAYWDGFGNYKYRTKEEPQYKRIAEDDPWEKSLRIALLRIRAHMAGEIPARGNSREGQPSLCVYANDLENVHASFFQQTNAAVQHNWPALPRFVKVYSDVHCKQRKTTDTDFIKAIVELNYWREQMGGDEIRLLYELGYAWDAFEGFIKRHYLLTQVVSTRRRYDGLMQAGAEEPCTQRLMLQELEGIEKEWSRYVGVPGNPHQEQLMQYRKALAAAREAMIAARLAALQEEKADLTVALAAIDRDSCLSAAEKLRLTKVVRDLSVDEEKESLEYGIDVVDDLRTTIGNAFGEDALANVFTKVFRVEGGVGVELTMRGGGAIMDKRLRGRSDDASDTTTVYRSGFPLGSIGDTLSATIAQVFWDRMCEDYSSRRWAYRTESVEISGMADGVPVRSKLYFSERCIEELKTRGISKPNEQLAFARAWSLQEHVAFSDRCGLFDLLNPSITYRTFSERGGDFRGVVMRAVMKRL